MKKHLYLLILILTIQSGQAQQIVRDKYKHRQLESMVVTRWGKFLPKWYYILMHNKYRKGEDRRTMWQLLPTVVSVHLTENQSNLEKENVNEVFEQYVAIDANRTLQPVYYLHFKPKLEEVNHEIDMLKTRARQAGADAKVLQIFDREQQRLNEQTTILKEGFLSQGESAGGYAEVTRELGELKAMISKYIRHQKILNKYNQL